MYQPSYYRQETIRARRLANSINHPEARDTLLNVAKDYDDIATDLENGAIEVRHPELMPQSKKDDKAS